jgi:thiamine-phosphate pyrophosphorylase
VKTIDLRVYVITASLPRLGRTHEDIATAAIQGGATAIQFRDKLMAEGEFIETASRVAAIARAAGVPFIVNDRVAIAIAIGADGVHVGRKDGDIREIRKSLSAGMILGVSATDYDDAVRMSATGADYLGVGPIFPTGSKDDATTAIGPDELARICREVKQPVVAIGGINTNNLRCIIDVGTSGAAVIAAIAEAPDMAAATTKLRRVW